MLSKVLSGKDTERAQPLKFAVAAERSFLSVKEAAAPPEDAARDDQNRALRTRIEQLEIELAAAKRDAFEAGRQQGDQKARSEMLPVIERMNASLSELTAMRQDLRRRAENDVVKLSLLIARRVLHREVTVDHTALNALARVVFERLARAESYRVTVHPQFAGPMKSALSGRLTSRVEIDADSRCPLGTFVVRSEEGTVDASVDSQLEEIGHGLTDRLTGS